jgi:hypothetical protein
MALNLNDVIRLPDGREGTICWNHLDGNGGVWGRHHFDMPEGGFGDELPAPEFMLREKEVEGSLRRGPHRADVECVGKEYEVLP